MIKIVESRELVRLIEQQPKHKHYGLLKLLRLQEKYRETKTLNIFFLGLLSFQLKKIEKEYNIFPKEVELLHKLYLMTL